MDPTLDAERIFWRIYIGGIFFVTPMILNEWIPPRKRTLQWKIHHLKIQMYLLLNMGIFQCHVSFQENLYGFLGDIMLVFWGGTQNDAIILKPEIHFSKCPSFLSISCLSEISGVYVDLFALLKFLLFSWIRPIRPFLVVGSS